VANWRPKNAGPRNLRELYHWAWTQLKSAGGAIGDEGGTTPPDPPPTPGHQHWHDNLINVTPDQHHPQIHAHNTHTGIGPDDHHPQLHDIDSHTDVDLLVSNLKEGQGIWYDAGTGLWKNRGPITEAFPTGLVNGGELNIGPGINDVEVIAGYGFLMDAYTDPLSPAVAVALQWNQINEPITAAPAVAGSVVWVSLAVTATPGTPIDDLGGIPVFFAELNQYAQPLTPTLQRQEIALGVLVHNGVEWKEVSSPKVVNQVAETLREFVVTVNGPSYIISGGDVSEEPAFTLNQAEGVIWENNRNWHVDKTDPNRETLPASVPIVFAYVNRDFTDVGGPTSTIDPTMWDDAGVVSAVPGAANTTTIQRLYIDPANNYWILWGQYTYPNFLTAQANLFSDNPVVPFILQNSILLGYIVAEKQKTDWDIDEAIFVPAGSGGAGAGGGGTPITDHNNLNGIGPDDHHNQVHLLYGSDHSDVDTATPLAQQHGLFWDGVDSFDPDYRTKGKAYSVGVTYFPQDMVYQDGYLSIANTETTDYPVPQVEGEPVYVYQGAAPTAPVTVKQIIFGNRYLLQGASAQIATIRIYTVTGNTYVVYSVSQPNVDPILKQLLAFTADSTGWREFNIDTVIIGDGAEFDLLCQVQEPDPTPTTFTGNWNYQTPQNPIVPTAGQIQHSRGQPDLFDISKTDNDAVDRSADLAGLAVGDIIDYGNGGVRWAIQSIVDNGTYYRYSVSPALVETAGVNLFTFETVTPTPVTRMEDVDWWLNNPPTAGTAQGLYIEDGSYVDIVPNNSAYGVDIILQRVVQSPDWDLFGLPGGAGGGGGGGDFTPTIFQGAGTTGYVPDPVTEQGYVLSDSGAWVEQSGGGFWEAGTNPDDIVNANVGNVGIGTDSPERPLTVAGVLSARTAADDAAILLSPTSTVNTILSRAGNSSAAALPLVFMGGAAERMRIDAEGNVGIGTDSPNFLLSIKEVAAAVTDIGDPAGWNVGASIRGDGTYQGAFMLTGADSSASQPRAGIHAVEGGVSAATDMAFGTRDTSAVYAERMRITSAGNVAIGITAANNPLVVSGIAAFRDSVAVGYDPVTFTTAGFDKSINIYNTGIVGYRLGGDINGAWLSYTDTGQETTIKYSGGGHLRFTNGGTIDNAVERMRITSDGHVGINELNPTAPLVVSDDTPIIAQSLAGRVLVAINRSSNAVFSAQTSNSSYGGLEVGDPENSAVGTLRYYHNDNGWVFRANITDALKIEATTVRAYNTLNVQGAVPDANGTTISIAAKNTLAVQVVPASGAYVVAGWIQGVLIQASSSIIHKENVVPLSSGVDVIKTLKPREFTWKDTVMGHDAYPVDIGFIAEELELVLPQAVVTNTGSAGDQSNTAVRDRPIVAMLVKAVQELTARLEALENA